jgi:hypothetical protein
VAELVDAPDSKSGGGNIVLVRVRPGAPDASVPDDTHRSGGSFCRQEQAIAPLGCHGATFRANLPGAVHTHSIWYNGAMTKDQVKEILDRVLTWPPKRQEDAARFLREMEAQDASPYRITDQQVEEIERRRADFMTGKERYATDEEMAALWKKCGL